MQMVFDHDAARLHTFSRLRGRCYHFCAIKFLVIAAMAKGVLTEGGVLSVIGSTLLAQDE